MKKIKSSFFLLFAAFTIGLAACTQNDTKKVSDSYKNPDNVAGRVPETGSQRTTEMGVDSMLVDENMVFKDSISTTFKENFVQLVDEYLKMKNAFVSDDQKGVDEHSSTMLAVLNQMPDNLLNGSALQYWREKKGFLLAHLTLYKKAENDSERRLNFVFLSTVMVKSVKAFGYDKTLYVNYCPMANNNKGAYWLSEIKEIRNPYMGQKMPDCGEIKKVF